MNYVYSANRTVNLDSTNDNREDHESVSIAFKHFGLTSPLEKLGFWLYYLGLWDSQTYVSSVGSWERLCLLESTSDSESTVSYDDSKGVATCTIRVHGVSGSPEIVKFTLNVNRDTCASEIRSKLSDLLGNLYSASACELMSVNIIVNGGT